MRLFYLFTIILLINSCGVKGNLYLEEGNINQQESSK